MLRIISGTAGGMKISTPHGKNTRPTSDMVREAMFNILYPQIEGARVLDLYSGSGALGIEALSRGASFALFIEQDRKCCEIIRSNLRRTNLLECATVLNREVIAGLNTISEKQFNIVFMDPPYREGLTATSIDSLLSLSRHNDLLCDGCILMVETSAFELLPKIFGDISAHHLRLNSRRKYGSTALTFYRYNDIKGNI